MWRPLRSSGRLGRILHFPPRVNGHGQYELFPPSQTPDPFSPSQVIIEYTLLQYRITRIASDLSPSQRETLLGQCHGLLLGFVEPMELSVAQAQKRLREAFDRFLKSA